MDAIDLDIWIITAEYGTIVHISSLSPEHDKHTSVLLEQPVFDRFPFCVEKNHPNDHAPGKYFDL